MSDRTIGTLDLPRVKWLSDFPLERFPFERRIVPGYGEALKLPYWLLKLFDQGMDAIGIDSLALARSLPDLGGKTSATTGILLFHQDNFGDLEDMREFLILAIVDEGPRGAPTLVTKPKAARLLLPFELRAFKALRSRFGKERNYDLRFKLSPEHYDRCFDHKWGFEEVTSELLGRHDVEPYRLKLNVLDYLMRGPTADFVMQRLMERYGTYFHVEDWSRIRVCIIRNPSVFHAKGLGVSSPLLRLFATRY